MDFDNKRVIIEDEVYRNSLLKTPNFGKIKGVLDETNHDDTDTENVRIAKMTPKDDQRKNRIKHTAAAKLEELTERSNFMKKFFETNPKYRASNS